MSEKFYETYKREIESAIKNNTIKYTIASGSNSTTTIHCYYMATKKLSISSYAVKNTKTKSVSGHLLKITIARNTKKQKLYAILRDTSKTAQHVHNMMMAKHEEQMLKTQLKRGFSNGAWAQKRK